MICFMGLHESPAGGAGDQCEASFKEEVLPSLQVKGWELEQSPTTRWAGLVDRQGGESLPSVGNTARVAKAEEKKKLASLHSELKSAGFKRCGFTPAGAVRYEYVGRERAKAWSLCG
jgi:hypothetical protein